MRWFVHVERTYYPSSGVIEADTAEEAAQAAIAEVAHWPRDDEVAVGVFPIDAGTWVGQQWCVDAAHEGLT